VRKPAKEALRCDDLPDASERRSTDRRAEGLTPDWLGIRRARESLSADHLRWR